MCCSLLQASPRPRCVLLLCKHCRAEALLCFCLQGCTVEKTTLKKRFFKRSLWAKAVLHYHMTATSLSDISRDNQVHKPVPSGMCFSTEDEAASFYSESVTSIYSDIVSIILLLSHTKVKALTLPKFRFSSFTTRFTGPRLADAKKKKKILFLYDLK